MADVIFSDSFAVRRGFAARPTLMGKFLAAISFVNFRGIENFEKKAAETFGPQYRAYLTALSRSYNEYMPRDVRMNDTVTFLLHSTSPDRLRWFLSRMFGLNAFEKVIRNNRELLGMTITREGVQEVFTNAGCDTDALDLYFNEGILQDVDLTRPPGTSFEDYVDGVLRGPAQKYFVFALGAAFNAAGLHHAFNCLTVVMKAQQEAATKIEKKIEYELDELFMGDSADEAAHNEGALSD